MTVERPVTPILLTGLVALLAASRLNGQTTKTISPADEQRIYVGCLVDEASFARATGLVLQDSTSEPPVQLILVYESDGATTRSAYALTGLRETELSSYVNSRVEVSGRIEKSRGASAPTLLSGSDSPGLIASGVSGVTPEGSPAHEPGDSDNAAPPETSSGVAATPTATASRNPQQVATIAELDRLNVVSVRALADPCGDEFRRREAPRAAPTPAVSPAPPGEPTGVRPLGPVVAIGCVIRHSTGDPSQQASASYARLGLTQAAVTLATSAISPGVLTGGGPGTVGTTADTANRVRNMPERGFLLEGHESELLTLVGQQVAVTGTIREQSQLGDDDRSAHASAPVDTLIVTSVRSGGGTCR